MNKVITYTLASAAFGSIIPVAAKAGLEAFGSFTMIFFRFSLGVAVLMFLIPRAQRGLKTAKQLWKESVLGALNPLLLFIALRFTDASIAGVIYSTIPILAALYSYKHLNERLSKGQITGLVVGIIGISLVTVLPLLQTTPDLSGLWANGLIVIASVCAMLFGVRSKIVAKKHNIASSSVIYHFSVMSLVLAVPFLGYEFLADGIAAQAVELRHVLGALGVGIGSLFGYLLLQKTLTMTSATSAFMVNYLQPVMTASLAVVFVDETISFILVIAAVLSFYGAWLVQQKAAG